MPDLPPGVDEELVTQGLDQRLRLIETDLVDRELLDPYVSHSGERPMRIIWKLYHELPADIFHSARVAAG